MAARSLHLPAIATVPGLKVAALLDPNSEALAAASRQCPSAVACMRTSAFFNVPLDAVVICSPAAVHAANLSELAAAPIPILCEKPLTLSRASAAKALAAARGPVYVAFSYRFSPVALRIRDLLQQDALGKVGSIRFVHVSNLGASRKASGELARRRARMRAGGPIFDLGVHYFDLARWWLGSDPFEVKAVGAWLDRYRVPDYAFVHTRHPNGWSTSMELSFSFGLTFPGRAGALSYDVVGSSGWIHYDREHREFLHYSARGLHRFRWAPERLFPPMYREFRAVLRGHSPRCLATGEDGLVATSLAAVALRRVGWPGQVTR